MSTPSVDVQLGYLVEMEAVDRWDRGQMYFYLAARVVAFDSPESILPHRRHLISAALLGSVQRRVGVFEPIL